MKYYFTYDGEYYNPCNSDGSNPKNIDYCIKNYGTSFDISKRNTLSFVHDITDHVNGLPYVGGVADEIMALASTLTHRKQEFVSNYHSIKEVFCSVLSSTLVEYFFRGLEWGLLPDSIDLNKRLSSDMPYYDDYMSLVEPLFIKREVVDSINKEVSYSIEDHKDIQEDGDFIATVEYLLYLGMVKSYKKWGLSEFGDYESSAAYAV